MPLYEYACPACAASFETLVRNAAEEAEVECPTCRSRAVTRQLSRPAAPRGAGARGGGGSTRSDCGPVG